VVVVTEEVVVIVEVVEATAVVEAIAGAAAVIVAVVEATAEATEEIVEATEAIVGAMEAIVEAMEETVEGMVVTDQRTETPTVAIAATTEEFVVSAQILGVIEVSALMAIVQTTTMATDLTMATEMATDQRTGMEIVQKTGHILATVREIALTMPTIQIMAIAQVIVGLVISDIAATEVIEAMAATVEVDHMKVHEDQQGGLDRDTLQAMAQGEANTGKDPEDPQAGQGEVTILAMVHDMDIADLQTGVDQAGHQDMDQTIRLTDPEGRETGMVQAGLLDTAPEDHQTGTALVTLLDMVGTTAPDGDQAGFLFPSLIPPISYRFQFLWVMISMTMTIIMTTPPTKSCTTWTSSKTTTSKMSWMMKRTVSMVTMMVKAMATRTNSRTTMHPTSKLPIQKSQQCLKF
jgi:hypothetical protein